MPHQKNSEREEEWRGTPLEGALRRRGDVGAGEVPWSIEPRRRATHLVCEVGPIDAPLGHADEPHEEGEAEQQRADDVRGRPRRERRGKEAHLAQTSREWV